ncbi:MAG TPA: HDIG domain-containing protein [Opitutaceae bacterium]|nr:HDIG domain-containing protein [Opitutaceae bacterium]
MSVRNQLKLLVGGLGPRRPGRPSATTTAMGEFLERSRLVAAVIFIVTVAAIVLISSAGVSTLNIPIRENHVASTRVTALASFNYESAHKTRAAREQFVGRVPPVYRLETEPLRKFEAAARTLLSRLIAFENTQPGVPVFTRRAELTAIADGFNAAGPYFATADDMAALLSIDARTRAALFENGNATLRDIYAEGVTDSALNAVNPGSALVFQVARPNGAVAQRSVQSLEDALTLLRVSLANDSIPRTAAQAVFRLFRYGVTSNLVFDPKATQARQVTAGESIQPVMVKIAQGQTIIEQGDRVTPEQYEMFLAHRDFIRAHNDTDLREGLTLFGRVLLVLAMVLASLIYIRIEDPETLRSNIRCGLLALVVIVNLALVRANYSLGGAEFFVRDGSWASTLPYVAPTAFAPLIVAILIDAGSGIFMALLISIFTGVIYGNRLDLLVLTFLASLVTIYFGRDARRRGRLVRAAGMGGLTVAAFAAMIGFAEQTQFDTLARQMSAGLATGLLTGIAVVGLLPVLESLFKRTTDITLLELTDYNHPLLRHMQLEAPGTYHHSLVVAQLSENAANAIGANPLVARVCALFHDVGKTLHPQFFGENQRDRIDPHADRDPTESARIIKQHVPDGVELAHKHNLPAAVIDVIRQHHGTTLVRYFYHRAIEQSRAPFPKTLATRKAPGPTLALPVGPQPDAALVQANAPLVTGAAAKLPDAEIFRYDGPRPQFKESAIISLADGVEASTRSLRQIGPEELHELVNRVVDERIAEGQLDEAPLTLEEISRIKNSFQFTLLNMLHSRVAYPPADETAVQGGDRKTGANG